ncbi:MAG: glycoside hydrolase family 9 protein [Bacteroidota bacterium]
MKNLLLPITVLLFLFSNLLSAQVVCDDLNNDGICDFSNYIHIDQFGYLESATKVAVVSDPQSGFNASESFTPNGTLEIRDASSEALVFSGNAQPWNSGATHAQSGDKGWWFDFSSVDIPGEYFVYDPVQQVRSPNFKIGNDVYEETLKAAMKMFYYNRCNHTKATPYAAANWTDGMNFTNTLQDANCRYVNNQANASLEKDLTGGWFDAGDYNKYVTFTRTTLQHLLWAYRENPTVFGDNWNIPESGNGIPDILDEVKWELDWLLKMTNADGSVHIKMGNISYDDNAAAPPSANTDPRYYGPTCTSASIAVAGIFAHAAKVFQDFPSMSTFAATLETNAINAWNYALPHLNNNTLETNCDNGTIKAGDADMDTAAQRESAVEAAIYLFDLTAGSSYNQYVVNHLNDTETMMNNYWGGYNIEIHDALLHYSTLSGADASVAATITTSFSTAASNNWEGFYGFNSDDLYRAFMPDYSYHWGSNMPKANYGVLNLQLVKYNINPSATATYASKAAEQIHYFHGVNPLGLVQLSNMYALGADRGINEIYHTWFYDGTDWDNTQTSLYGPAPGFLTGGANQGFSVTTLSPPSGQPIQKSYLDFNTGWPDNSWEISEPAIYYQAAYIRLLASQIAESSTTPLPVELVYFNVEVVNDEVVKLSWRSASEIDNDYFEIQRSQDGLDFKILDRVDGLGNAQTGAVYIAVDSTPLEGLSYYRIKQVDTDGSFEYFPIKTVFFESKGIQFSIFPNPVKEKLQVKMDAKNKIRSHLQILSSDGKIVIQRSTLDVQAGENVFEINVAHLSQGVYFLKMDFGDGAASVYRRIVIKD